MAFLAPHERPWVRWALIPGAWFVYALVMTWPLAAQLGLDPLAKAIIGSRFGAQVGLVQSFPLAPGAQDIKDRVSTDPIGHTRSTAGWLQPVNETTAAKTKAARTETFIGNPWKSTCGNTGCRLVRKSGRPIRESA